MIGWSIDLFLILYPIVSGQIFCVNYCAEYNNWFFTFWNYRFVKFFLLSLPFEITLIFHLEKISTNRKNKLKSRNEINKTDYTKINR